MQRLSPDLEAVLVIGPNWIGDAVMSTPALANLRRDYPRTIDLLVPRHVAPLFDDHPHIDRVVVRDERQPWRTRLAQVIACVVADTDWYCCCRTHSTRRWMPGWSGRRYG